MIISFDINTLIYIIILIPTATFLIKIAYWFAEADIVNNTNFKALYGANNQKVRKEHCKSELSDMVSQMKDLEFSINWIKNYIPLLRGVIRVKSN